MEVKEFIAQVREQLTDNFEENKNTILKMLVENKRTNGPDKKLIDDELTKLLLEIAPPKLAERFKKMAFADGKRLDELYHQGAALMRNDNIAAASFIFKQLTDHIIDNFWDTEGEVYFSFNSPFEQELAGQLFRVDKRVIISPFDFSDIFFRYGYCLIEMKKYDEAIDALEKAISFNPVNANAYLELAELYKARREPEMLLYTTKDTLKIAYSAEILARCYCNLGYYAIEIEDYKSALAFYTMSTVFKFNERVVDEMRYALKLAVDSGLRPEDVNPKDDNDLSKAFEKIKQERGPNGVVVRVMLTMAKMMIDAGNLAYAKALYGLAADLTTDPKIKQMYESIVLTDANPAVSDNSNSDSD